MPVADKQGGLITCGGKGYVDFSSNDYLGLAGHPELIKAATEALMRYGTSSSASRLLSGDVEIHHKLEEEIARFKNKEAALVFNSGYQANIGILSALYGKGDAIFSDRLNHASIVDGIILSGSKLFRFKHNDLGHLEELLTKERPNFKKALIVTETVFSMDGDRPSLKELTRLKERYGCQMMVDEAHATGIYGPCGSGVVEAEGLSDRIDFVMGTFGKALGGFGAFLAASKDVIAYLVNTSRSFIYSTALPPSVTASNLAAIKVIANEPGRRRKLLESAQFFRDAIVELGFEVRGSSQIVPLIVGDNNRTVKLAETLKGKGYWVLPIRPPTVPKGEARIRFSLTVYHDKRILKRLADDMREIRI